MRRVMMKGGSKLKPSLEMRTSSGLAQVSVVNVCADDCGGLKVKKDYLCCIRVSTW